MGKTSTTPKTPKTPKAQQKTPKRKEPPKSDANGEKQENEAKRQKQQPDLMSFFKPKEKPAPLPTLPKCMPNNSLFQTLFQLKAGMTLAPIFVRQPLTASERDHLLDQHDEVSDYLAQCKRIKKKPATNVDVLKAKYYHFKADGSNRPPYYGTWRRRSAAITGRRPFNKEEKTLNYDYDSDDDWEDEPADADECKSDDEELEKEDEQMSESEDDGFFVDHGYLSSDEGSGAEEDDELLLLRKGKPGDGEEAKLAALVPPHHSLESEEQRRQRLAQKAEEWKDQQRQKERRNKKRQLIPTVYLPAEYIHPVLHRNIMAGVLFDYSTILASSNLDAMDGNGKVGEEEVLVPPPPPPNPLDQMPAELKMAMTAAGSSG